MTNYAFEKGKYGGPCGCIFPFFQELSNIIPDATYRSLVPAGFLRCRGQILNADDYPNLARVIGVGEDCIYKKEGSTLRAPNTDGTGGQIQLPDLGSKYITAGTNSGEYLNMTTEDSAGRTIDRAGIQTTLSSSSNQIQFFYDGDFGINSAGGANNMRTSGSWRLNAPTRTPEQTLFINNFLAHGHGSSISVARFLVDREAYRNTNLDGILCLDKGPWLGGALTEQFEAVHLDLTLSEVGDETQTNHSHFGLNARITRQQITRASIGDATTTIPSDGLVTTVTLNTNNITKMDEIAPKFILCEYLIKF